MSMSWKIGATIQTIREQINKHKMTGVWTHQWSPYLESLKVCTVCGAVRGDKERAKGKALCVEVKSDETAVYTWPMVAPKSMIDSEETGLAEVMCVYCGGMCKRVDPNEADCIKQSYGWNK